MAMLILVSQNGYTSDIVITFANFENVIYFRNDIYF